MRLLATAGCFKLFQCSSKSQSTFVTLGNEWDISDNPLTKLEEFLLSYIRYAKKRDEWSSICEILQQMWAGFPCIWITSTMMKWTAYIILFCFRVWFSSYIITTSDLPVEVNSVFPGLDYYQKFLRFLIKIYGEFDLCLQIQVLLLLSQLLTS